MSTVKMIELYENIPAVTVEERRNKKLADWVGWQLQCLRKTYSAAHGITVDVFAERVGVSKKRLYELERGDAGFPGLDLLNGIVLACDTDLAEFFGRMVTHAKLADMQGQQEKDQRLIEALVKALSHPQARQIVEGAAAGLSVFFRTEGDQ